MPSNLKTNLKQTTANPVSINVSTVPPNFFSEPAKNQRGWIVTIVILAIVAAVFVSMFFIERGSYRAKCEDVMIESFTSAVAIINECANDSFDYDTQYRELISEFGCARKMIFNTNLPEDWQVCVTNLYSASVKVPNQIKENLIPIKDALTKIIEDDRESGFGDLQQIISTFDLKDY